MARTGRPREFDRDHALAKARDLFWTRGYADTSVQDLVDKLAVQRGSLYGAFGDKHALYLEAVALYWADNRARLQAALESGPVLPVLREMLTQPGTVTGARRGLRGCLIGNTTIALVPDDAAATTLVGSAFGEFVDVVATAIARGQQSGEIRDDVEPATQARLILILFQGSTLLRRAPGDAGEVDASIVLALDALAVSTGVATR